MQLEHFNLSEFDCNCGKCGCTGELYMDWEFLVNLDEARGESGVPYVISRGYTCELHNKSAEVGGSPTSSHLSGLAVDIAVPDSRSRFHILRGLLHVGFHRIGIYPGHIHIDADPFKDIGVAWLD